MKLSKMPLANRLQAIETILDSTSQSKVIDRRRLKIALKIVRSVQRTLFGPRYVTEWSLLRHFSPKDYNRDSKSNWRLSKRRTALSQNERLTKAAWIDESQG
jgi:hypothetical protein